MVFGKSGRHVIDCIHPTIKGTLHWYTYIARQPKGLQYTLTSPVSLFISASLASSSADDTPPPSGPLDAAETMTRAGGVFLAATGFTREETVLLLAGLATAMGFRGANKRELFWLHPL